MVQNHFRFFEYLEDRGAGGLALTILRDGIFKPTPRGQKPLTWLQELDEHGKYKFVDGSKLRARPWARVKLEVERGAQHVFLTTPNRAPSSATTRSATRTGTASTRPSAASRDVAGASLKNVLNLYTYCHHRVDARVGHGN